MKIKRDKLAQQEDFFWKKKKPPTKKPRAIPKNSLAILSPKNTISLASILYSHIYPKPPLENLQEPNFPHILILKKPYHQPYHQKATFSYPFLLNNSKEKEEIKPTATTSRKREV